MVALTRQNLGQPQRDVSVFEQQNLVNSYEPSTSTVAGAFIEEAFQGVGTLAADLRAGNVEKATGAPLTPEVYKESQYFRPEIDYYEGMTTGAAEILAENQDEVNRRNFIIGSASGGQQALGFVSAFGAGLFEPKNLGVGMATALVGGAVISQVGSARRLYQMSMKAGKYKTRAGLGAVEGLVAAAALEPSNRDSAKILQQDYTMADSVMNIALSTVLGAGLNSVPGFIGDKMKARKLNKVTAKLQAEALDELDMATAQVAQGKELDVSSVSKSQDVNISKLEPEAKAAKVEQYVKYTETEQFKTKFEGSKVVDENGAPLRVYHGTNKDFKDFAELSHFGTADAANAILEAYGPPPDDGRFSTRVIPVYLNIKKPLRIIDSAEPHSIDDFLDILESGDILGGEDIDYIDGGSDRGEKMTRLADKMLEAGYDGVVYKNAVEDAGSTSYIAIKPDQVIPAFGGGDMNALAKQIDVDNKTAVVDAVKRDNDPTNDTGIDWQTAKELDEYDKTTLDEQIAYEEEIANLREQGLLTEVDELALQQVEGVELEWITKAHDAAYFCLTKG